MNIIQQLRDRNASSVDLVDRIVAGLRAARTADGFAFLALQDITQLDEGDAPVLADVLATLVQAEYLERHIVVSIPAHGFEAVYPNYSAIPLDVTAADGTKIRVLVDHLKSEYRGTARLAV
jgi:hypothetical protein